MFRRWMICVLLASVTSTAYADPLLLLLLRMMRDQAVTASIEAGIGMLRKEAPPAAPTFGYPLSLPSSPDGEEEQRLRTLIDESFLHLIPAQREAVFAGMQKIMRDPQHASRKAQIFAEFALKAREVREGYRSLERLSSAARQTLAAQAKQSYARLAAADRHDLLEVLRSGMLPIPRDFNDFILSELTSVTVLSTNDQRR